MARHSKTKWAGGHGVIDYLCEKCGDLSQYQHIDAGVTPNGMICPSCGGHAVTDSYTGRFASQTPAHYLEWFRPSFKQAKKITKNNAALMEHIMEGGLIDRKDKIDALIHSVLLDKFKGMETYVHNKDIDDFAGFCHSQLSGGIGMKIRNWFGLWKDNALTQLFKDKYGLEHAHQMSDYIIRRVYVKMSNKLIYPTADQRAKYWKFADLVPKSALPHKPNRYG